jgi:uncharacterized protein involved in tolerance to divalent cations
MKNALIFCLLLVTVARASDSPSIVTDGQSLGNGLQLYQKSKTASSMALEDVVTGVMAAAYTQAFVSSCYVWEEKFPKQAPFNLPLHVTTEDSIKIAQKYLAEHPDRLHERAEFLLFDAVVAAFPRK